MRQTVAGLPQFLRYLGTFPAPQELLDALHRGPLSHVGAKASSLWQVAHDTELVTLATVGYSRDEVDRYQVIPLHADVAITAAIRSRHIAVDDAASFGHTYLGAIDADLWSDMVARLRVATVVSVPVIHAGRPVGGFGFVTDQPWDAAGSMPLLCDAVAAVLALWMTHPEAGLADAVAVGNREWSLAFTPRQQQILRLVEQGRSTRAMAAELGVSESSVKADLQQAMRAMRTSDRRDASARARTLGLL